PTGTSTLTSASGGSSRPEMLTSSSSHFDPTQTLSVGPVHCLRDVLASMLIVCSIGIRTQSNYALDIRLQGCIVTVRWGQRGTCPRAGSEHAVGGQSATLPPADIGVRSDALTSKELRDGSACSF